MTTLLHHARAAAVLLVSLWLPAAGPAAPRAAALASAGEAAGGAPRPIAVPALQGAGPRSAHVNERVVTSGVVVAVLTRGFYLQDPDGDGDAATSDGLYVYTARPPRVAVGDRVRVTGTVAEFGADPSRTQTELTRVSVVRTGAAGALPLPVRLALPMPPDALERVEGMRVVLDGTFTVLPQAVFGPRAVDPAADAASPADPPDGAAPPAPLSVACHPGLRAPTDTVRPGDAARRLAERNAGCRLQLAVLPTARTTPGAPAWRPGDRLSDVVGVIGDGAFARRGGVAVHRLHATVSPAVVRAAAAPGRAPPAVGGDIRVAALNVHNFFTTLNDGVSVCFPGRPQHCRGARSAAERTRQRAKLAATLVALDADVVALAEVENNGQGAVDDLVAAVNARLAGSGVRYASVTATGRDESPSAVNSKSTPLAAVDPKSAPLGAVVSKSPRPAGDAIQVALLHRVGRVTPVGPAMRDGAAVHERPPLAQPYRTASGHVFTVVAAHLKSKRCDRARGPDADAFDGQGCFNARRVRQAEALQRFAARVAQRAGSDDVLLIGDFNAHAREDPLHVLGVGGYVDVMGRFDTLADAPACTYVHDGVCGRLDHALASPSLASRVTGARVWHVNAGRPFGAGGPDDPVGSSDHDPIVVGMAFAPRAAAPSGGTPAAEATQVNAEKRRPEPR